MRPVPFSFRPDQTWNGNAGSWSTFIIRIGTPSQEFSVLPSTNGHQPWIPIPVGCTSENQSDCGALRGVRPFQGVPSNGFLANRSSTWQENGLFNLANENGLDLTGNGDYGYDTVGLGGEGSGGLTLSHQVVAGIATDNFYLGQFGLGPKPSNFSTKDDPVSGYLQDLAESRLIPSFSYGYTAGAKYRSTQVFGSLTFGGYDASRFISSNISIPFASDDSRSLTVGVQSIVISNSIQGSVQPLSHGEFFLIDSTVPDLWLPRPACDLFEEAFGLTYDNSTDLYRINDSIHSRLKEMNPVINLKIGRHLFERPTVDISLPYGAFDLQASSPIYPNATRYFPIRRARNSTQYTLGRTFLQEAYLVVDYERSNFTVNQAIFHSPNPKNIVTILPRTSSPRLDHGAIAGIAVGTSAFLAIIITIAVILTRRKKGAKRKDSSPVAELPNGEGVVTSAVWYPELDAKADAQRPPHEMDVQRLPEEMDVQRSPRELEVPALPRLRYELENSSTLGELPSAVVS